MCKCNNPYIPFPAEITDILVHTDVEWTFRTKTDSSAVKPGQFYEISIPKYGESPISVSGIGENYVDFTIRNVGKVTKAIFDYNIGDQLFLRGPYGNGFEIEEYKGKDLVIVVGGSALAPVRGIIEYAFEHPEEFKSFQLIAGFRSPEDILFKEDLKKWSQKLSVLVTVDKAEETYSGNIGLVTKYIPNLSYSSMEDVVAVVVGPPMMMKFSIQEFSKLNLPEKNIWVSYERKMYCGIGKCGHCKMDSTYICLDGPVFNYSFAKNLED